MTSLATMVRRLRVARCDNRPVEYPGMPHRARGNSEGHPKPADIGCGGFCRVAGCIEIATGKDGFCQGHQERFDAGDEVVAMYALRKMPMPKAPRRNRAGFVKVDQTGESEKNFSTEAEG